jgi:hypothetical protein
MIVPIGILCLDSETKERVFYPVEAIIPQKSQEVGKITKQPSPEEVEIEKERKPDFSLSGILRKHR